MIAPIVHTNGTSRDELVDQLCRAGAALRLALDALSEAAPNARDYYPEPGRLALAQLQHADRVRRLHSVLTDLQIEAEIISYGE